MTDDVEFVRRFRSEVPQPDGAAWARARSALTRAIETERDYSPPTLRAVQRRIGAFLADHAAWRKSDQGVPHPAASDGRRARPRLAFAVVPIALVAAALAVVLSLGGTRTAIAQAEVLTRATAALDQPDTILYVQERVYGADVVCPPEWAWWTTAKPPCLGGIGGGASTANQGISADPTQDTLNFSLQEWMTPDQSEDHTLYSNGDETVYDAPANQYQVYDPTDNTLTTLDGNAAPTSPPPLARVVGPFGVSGDVASGAAYFEQLYKEAQSGAHSTVDELSGSAQLIGETTIDGHSAYELSFDTNVTPPPNTPASDMCGSTACSEPGMQTLLYLDSQTFMPVRSVIMTIRANRPGSPTNTTVDIVADYTIQSLPNTPANQALLQMTAHPGAAQVQRTLPPSAAGSTGSTGATGTTGSTDTGASGATS